ncbi:hypothetical protein NDU88_007078 [Pleurodeles waltl]|uniref:Uncharacterized protein n=1 Tax=Pleurodeles waltl TaxID=8319 RepID=A0AAV7WG08_PLEWA|nr:hypothetical protein NDU88_007078 [Pleurodeles waltl]
MSRYHLLLCSGGGVSLCLGTTCVSLLLGTPFCSAPEVELLFVSVPPVFHYVSVPPVYRYVSVPPVFRYVSVPPVYRYVSVPPVFRYVSVPPVYRYVSVPPVYRYVSVPPVFRYVSVPPVFRCSSVPPVYRFVSSGSLSRYHLVHCRGDAEPALFCGSSTALKVLSPADVRCSSVPPVALFRKLEILGSCTAHWALLRGSSHCSLGAGCSARLLLRGSCTAHWALVAPPGCCSAVPALLIGRWLLRPAAAPRFLHCSLGAGCSARLLLRGSCTAQRALAAPPGCCSAVPRHHLLLPRCFSIAWISDVQLPKVPPTGSFFPVSCARLRGAESPPLRWSPTPVASLSHPSFAHLSLELAS